MKACEIAFLMCEEHDIPSMGPNKVLKTIEDNCVRHLHIRYHYSLDFFLCKFKWLLYLAPVSCRVAEVNDSVTIHVIVFPKISLKLSRH